MSMPFFMKGLGISAASSARKPPLRAASASSTALAIRSSSLSPLYMKALPATLNAIRNWLRLNFIMQMKREPSMVI
ncbi:hypothetical protein D3C72_2222750 [compost metagenome]